MSHRHKDKESETTIKAHIQTLQHRQNSLVKTITLSESEIIQRRLERDYEDLEDQIQRANQELVHCSLYEEDIDAYFSHLKTIMEHPSEMLLSPTTKTKLLKSWSLVFPEPPSYEELKNGTPAMSLVFKLLRDSDRSKDQLADLLSLQWNTFEQDIRLFLAIEGELQHTAFCI